MNCIYYIAFNSYYIRKGFPSLKNEFSLFLTFSGGVSRWTQQGINSVEVSLPEPEEVKPEHPRCPPWPWHLCSSISSDLLWFLVSNLLAGALGGVQWTLDQALGMSRGQKRKERLYFNIPCSLAACGIIATSYWISASLCVMFILKRSLSSLAKQRDFSGEGMAGSRSRRLSVKCYIDDKILKEPVRGEQSFSFLFTLSWLKFLFRL